MDHVESLKQGPITRPDFREMELPAERSPSPSPFQVPHREKIKPRRYIGVVSLQAETAEKPKLSGKLNFERLP